MASTGRRWSIEAGRQAAASYQQRLTRSLVRQHELLGRTSTLLTSIEQRHQAGKEKIGDYLRAPSAYLPVHVGKFGKTSTWRQRVVDGASKRSAADAAKKTNESWFGQHELLAELAHSNVRSAQDSRKLVLERTS
ncbi:hypothetical protein Sjap_019781 [Stephania japonica]|uniref:Uncharacterized protein n=1 Tax=Stephania japonica TaxID=461633 RepID=A0AAP0F4Y3_9MAGN